MSGGNILVVSLKNQQSQEAKSVYEFVTSSFIKLSM